MKLKATGDKEMTEKERENIQKTLQSPLRMQWIVESTFPFWTPGSLLLD